MQRPIDPGLNLLRDKILLMGGATETAIARAIVARDSALAAGVIRDDDRIDRLEVEIDEACIETLVLQQPTASDLRFVVGVAKAAPNIERIADHAVNIAKHALALNDEPRLTAFVELERMGGVAQEMLMAGLDAFTSVDSEKAWEVIKRDDEVDALYRVISDELEGVMVADPGTIGRAIQLTFVVKHLERIADYVTNICELVIYMKRGAVIKHVIQD
jgi:phosphate transport system protein